MRLIKLKNKMMFGFIATGIALIFVVIFLCAFATANTGSGSIEDYMLNLGYKNCFMCHAGGEIPVPVAHCSNATVNQCLDCHIDMRIIEANIIAENEKSNLKSSASCERCHGGN